MSPANILGANEASRYAEGCRRRCYVIGHEAELLLAACQIAIRWRKISVRARRDDFRRGKRLRGVEMKWCLARAAEWVSDGLKPAYFSASPAVSGHAALRGDDALLNRYSCRLAPFLLMARFITWREVI